MNHKEVAISLAILIVHGIILAFQHPPSPLSYTTLFI